ncbi:MAG: N-6 DNA methylase [Christensenellaceae bacterium]|jgi:type I restriction-modification system DNA methylase subunit|nr:N-6 DNA methylase [Christensenellaceae bacterium]
MTTTNFTQQFTTKIEEVKLSLTQAYKRENFINLLNVILDEFKEGGDVLIFDRSNDLDNKAPDIESVTEIGVCKLPLMPEILDNSENELKVTLKVWEVHLNCDCAKMSITFNKTMIQKLMDFQTERALLVVFVSKDNNAFHLSLLTGTYDENPNGGAHGKFTNTRRSSYKLGVGAKTKTIIKFLIEKERKVNSIKDLRDRFSVEDVNKQFYTEVALFFTKLKKANTDTAESVDLKIKGDLTANTYSEFAVRLIGRIVFCWFLKEKKSVNNIPLMPLELLSSEAVDNNQDYYHSILEPLFFETLNTEQNKRIEKIKNNKNFCLVPFLNGGLFSPEPTDFYNLDQSLNDENNQNISISDKWFKEFFLVLEQYNFTIDENTSSNVVLSVDPEMLGRIFENLLAEINPETGESAKKSTGSFYTPREIVDYMVDVSLFEYLKNKTNISDEKLEFLLNGDDNNSLNPNEIKNILNNLKSLTILDPACGSGAFPIGLLQKIVYIFQKLDPDATTIIENYPKVLADEIKRKIDAKAFDYIRKLLVLQKSIYGVDIQPIAIEISRLRCFLSLIIDEEIKDDEENRGIRPLPNLDFKFAVANTLVGLIREEGALDNIFELLELKNIREKYFSENDQEAKSKLRNEYISTQEKVKSFYGCGSASKYSRSLLDWKPFENAGSNWFDPQWMFGIESFDIVIANPPYVHLEDLPKNTIEEKDLIKSYKKYNSYDSRGDLYCLFYERGTELSSKNGFLTYITSNKWMRSGYGTKIKNYFLERTNPKILIDLGSGVFSSATVDTNILVLQNTKNNNELKGITYNTNLENLKLSIKDNLIAQDYEQNEAWAILEDLDRQILKIINSTGTPLKKANITSARGIETGCNKAFLIDERKRAELISLNPNSAEIIRPILRGRDLARNNTEFHEYLICTHEEYKDRNGQTVARVDVDKYPVIKAHLDQFKSELEIRTDKGRTPYNLRFCAYMDTFSTPVICWQTISPQPQFYLTEANMLVLNSSYFFLNTNNSTMCLYSILKSSLFFYWSIFNVQPIGSAFMFTKQNLELFPAVMLQGDDRYLTDNEVFSLYGLDNIQKEHVVLTVKNYNKNLGKNKF